MYCSTCECEFNGWTGNCPNCKNPLLEGKPPSPSISDESITYETLVNIVRDNGGTLDIDLNAIEVGKTRSTRFPWLGYGYARTKRMQGSREEIKVDLTTEVGKDRKWEFPYQGLGYAWTEDMDGQCGEDIKIQLTTTDVGKIRRWLIPYFGFGYAWVNEGILSLSLNNSHN